MDIGRPPLEELLETDNKRVLEEKISEHHFYGCNRENIIGIRNNNDFSGIEMIKRTEENSKINRQLQGR